jgi:hypothetical protein
MEQEEQQGATAEALVWAVSPWATNWRRPAAALALCVFVALLGGFAFTYPNYSVEGLAAAELAARDNWWISMIGWSGLSLLLLLGMTATIYLPVRYKLDAGGVTTSFLGIPQHRSWAHYRNFYVHETGVHLTTMPRPSRLDAFRGHFLQYAGNRDEVVAFIERNMTLRGVPEGQEPHP